MTTSVMRRAAGFAAAFFWAATALATGEFVYPQSGPLTSTYYSSRSYGIHGALDIAGPNATPITAARSGRVSFTGWNGGYGNLVIVNHENGYQTYYAHMSRITISNGASVARGQQLGLEGSTGNSTGPHVHFEIRRNGAKQFIPGSGGQYVQRGNAIPQTYSGLSGDGGGGGNPTPSLTAQQVNASTLNVRTGPGTGFSVMGTVRNGQIYASNAVQSGWRRIYYDSRTGWCSESFLTRRTNGRGRRITASVLNVRTGPSTGNSITGTCTNGEVFVADTLQNGWLRIWYRGGQFWISEQYTSIVQF